MDVGGHLFLIIVLLASPWISKVSLLRRNGIKMVPSLWCVLVSQLFFYVLLASLCLKCTMHKYVQ